MRRRCRGLRTTLIAWWCSGSKASPAIGDLRPGRCSRPRATARAASAPRHRAADRHRRHWRERGLETVEHRQQVAQQLLVGEAAALRRSRCRRLRWFSRSARSRSDCARISSSSPCSCSSWSHRLLGGGGRIDGGVGRGHVIAFWVHGHRSGAEFREAGSAWSRPIRRHAVRVRGAHGPARARCEGRGRNPTPDGPELIDGAWRGAQAAPRHRPRRPACTTR